MAPTLRVARPSLDLEVTARFYTRGLGLRVLATFDDHDGFDGVVIGHPAWPYHLEFTRRRGEPLTPATTDEDLLVLYLPDRAAWAEMVERLRDAGAREVPNANPFWNVDGITFEDPDGYRLVLRSAAWEGA